MKRSVSEKDTHIRCQVGDELDLGLAATPTGCEWKLEHSGTGVRVESVDSGDAPFPPPEQIGAGVIDRFRVVALETGTTEVVFVQHAPWGAGRTWRATLEVSP